MRSAAKTSVALLVILALGALIAAVFLGVRFVDVRAQENARTSSLEEAKRISTTMLGYTPDNIDEHIAQSRGALAGDALTEYNELVEQEGLAQSVHEQGIVSEALIQDAGVVTNTKETATVLIFMNQSVTRGDDEVVSAIPSRLTFTMHQEDGDWKVSSITILNDETLRSRIGYSETAPEGAIPLDPTPIETPPGS